MTVKRGSYWLNIGRQRAQRDETRRKQREGLIQAPKVWWAAEPSSLAVARARRILDHWARERST